MHAVLITFRSAAALDDLAEPFTDYAKALREVDGLVAKTWLNDGDVLGGFHVFTGREAADNYLDSDMVAGLTSNPAFSGFEIRHFSILD
ncbi:MAG TPA: YdhR family protein, partial [Acidimicrobiia bacterium]|nr:YdhR family protein [Acidimicrobiia bacterium]